MPGAVDPSLMLRRTFQHLPGVGPWREKDLWAQGIWTWDDLEASGIDGNMRARLDEGRRALETMDLQALAKLLPRREHWRLYPAFADEALFFDIEADAAQQLTVVSGFDRDGLHVFISGKNMEQLPEALARRRLWVTFNGSVHDVPVLRTHFPALQAPAAHLDLRFLSRRVRWAGGLKAIEEQLGMPRPPHLRGVNGWDAILLWRAYQEGDIEALRFLVEYNLYDSISLRSVLEHGFNRAVELLSFDEPRFRVFDRTEVLYDVSKWVVGLAPTERDLQTVARIRAANT